MPTGAEALVDFVAFAARLKSCPDTERMIKGSWFPTHFAKNAKWMGHGAFVVGKSERQMQVLRLRCASLGMTSYRK
jgi:hypothetical protein